LQYMQKAMAFWQAIKDGRIADAFLAPPTVRPLGTLLVSFPFGFTNDYHGFLFRSSFVPIACSVVAVYLAAGLRRAKQDGWWIAAIALLFSSLPMFYQFDWNEENPGSSQWGLVDSFEAGIAALAAAMLLRSVRSRSLAWLFGATTSAALTVLIKP